MQVNNVNSAYSKFLKQSRKITNCFYLEKLFGAILEKKIEKLKFILSAFTSYN